MATDNPNGSPTMKPVKNPGKLNTSFWDSAFKDEKAGDQPPAKPKKKKVKKKSKMTAMWETKFAEQQKQVESTAYKPPPAKKVINTPPTSTDANGNDSDNKNDAESSETNTNGASSDSASKPSSGGGKISALAGKIAFNPMAMRGGLPPSLRKKREEQKEQGVELPGEQFARPIIPSSARRRATKKDIISITNEQINEELRSYLSTSFVFDEKMILSANILCLYLRDVAGIDLSSAGDDKWELQILMSAIQEVFGEKAKHSYGYLLRAM
mmetsp:Transcript_56634/g.90181  ORF Transcript_56634/g.90181 Transcript_56634/m.90181 type:complete len:269 (+) Transcript_56634:53-859(+)|eukprot:CAMPEP_0197037784 /NCGR_PEP_ID=MMETSP1384-20130603/14906_1 /TAXON_ID=29189 /ORGANISM="Ammonia sp." /LENGTH=268 /DNA_ID=CAMNT_0042468137 /DNA_START=30 /DNA_END=836 /DNA_ORIENTATION=+